MLPLALFAGVGLSQNKTPRVRLIASNPDGYATLEWSRDGRFVRVDPNDKRRELEWGTAYFQTKSGRRVTLDALKAQRLFSKAPFYFGFDAQKNMPELSICSASTGTCVPLKNQTLELHRLVLDFQVQNFYASTPDGRELVVVNNGQVRRWSTQTGALTSCVRFGRGSSDSSPETGTVSPDCRSFIAPTRTGAALFDVRTGKKKFSVASSRSFFVFRFSPSGRVFSTSLFDDESQETNHTFKNTSNGRTLWKMHSPTFSSPTFSPKGNLVALAGSNSLELRDFSTGKLKQRIQGSSDIFNMAFSPDGSTIWSSQKLDARGLSPILSWRIR